MGFFDRDFAISNVYSGFRLISRNRSDLASSNLRRRFRPFAAFADCSISMALDMALDAMGSVGCSGEFSKAILHRFFGLSKVIVVASKPSGSAIERLPMVAGVFVRR